MFKYKNTDKKVKASDLEKQWGEDLERRGVFNKSEQELPTKECNKDCKIIDGVCVKEGKQEVPEIIKEFEEKFIVLKNDRYLYTKSDIGKLNLKATPKELKQFILQSYQAGYKEGFDSAKTWGKAGEKSLEESKADSYQAGKKEGKREVRQFILNILDGIDIADNSMSNKGGGTQAIRHALKSRII